MINFLAEIVGYVTFVAFFTILIYSTPSFVREVANWIAEKKEQKELAKKKEFEEAVATAVAEALKGKEN